MRGNEVEQRALEEPCPVCAAAVGQACRPRRNREVQTRSAGPHRERISAAQRRIDTLISLRR